jgi:hypothetical protein
MALPRNLIKSLAGAAALTALLLAGAPGAAYAGATTEIDVRGDATPSLDVTKVEFRYDANGAHARVHVADLQPAGEFVFAVTNRTQSLRYGLAVTGLADGSRTSTFYRMRDGVLSVSHCGGSKARWSLTKDVVTMSFPERCFRALDRKVVMAVGSTKAFPDGTTVDEGPASVLKAPTGKGH